MARSVILFVTLGLLAVLAVQNTNPPIALIVLGSSTVPLPLSVWLLGAIAAGAITTLLIYGFANLAPPARRPYQPIGQRIRSSEPDARRTKSTVNRVVSEPSPSDPKNSAPATGRKKTAYDTDWESFKAPERWDNWGDKPDPQQVAEAKAEKARQQPKRGFSFKRDPYSANAAVNDLESGWEDSAPTPTSGASPIPPQSGGSPIEDSLDDIATGWDISSQDSVPPNYTPGYERPTTEVYSSGSLYDGPDRGAYNSPDRGADEIISEDIFDDSDNIFEAGFEAGTDDLEPAQVGPDGVYEADYRVIIPPYKPLDDADGDAKSEDHPLR